MNWTLHQGDSLTVLRTLPDESVNCVVTSPPYWGLRDYNVPGQQGLEPTFAEYLAAMTAVFSEVRRVLAKDGTCWVNMGDSYNAGTNKGRRWNNSPEAKQNHGYWNNQNIDRRVYDCRTKTKELIGQPWRLAFALSDDGWYLRQDIIWHKPNPMPESVQDRCTRAHEYLFMFTQSKRYYYDAAAIRTASITGDTRRPFGSEGMWQMDGRPEEQRHGGEQRKIKMPDGWDTGSGGHSSVHRNGREKGKTKENTNPIDTANRRSVWTIPTEGYPGAHFATFPPALVRPCIAAGCPADGVVLDPFCGSGTTLQVAVEQGCNAIGIELNPDYCGMIRTRMKNVTKSLFGGLATESEKG